MTLQQFLMKHLDEVFVIKNKYCTQTGDFTIAGKAKYIINNLNYKALQKVPLKINNEIIYIDWGNSG